VSSPANWLAELLRLESGSMNSISAALVVLSGAIIFSAGLLSTHAEPFWTGCVIGALLGFGGLMALIASVGKQDPPA
jgi:hypothetical protein